MDTLRRKLDLTDPDACALWDAFCTKHPGPTLFHSTKWARAVCETYGVQCRSFSTHDAFEGSVVSVFPLFKVRALSRKSLLVSVPYAPYGGALTSDGIADPIEQLTAWSETCDRAESRLPALWRQAGDPVSTEDKLSDTDRVTMWLELAADTDALWKSFPAKVRNQVRKAERAGVTLRTGPELLDDFYGLYSRRMHELGTPAHAKVFFQNLISVFAGAAEFVVGYHEHTPVAAVIDIEWGRWRVNLYGASDYAKRSICGNNLVYWESLKRGIENGRRMFDFGRSQYKSGQYNFKRQWGAEPVSVAEKRFRLDPDRGQWSEETVPGLNPRLARLWQTLPRTVARIMSSYLRKYVY